MTPAHFRKLALELPDAVESSHMSHPDFRVHNKIFATISQEGDFGVLKLAPDQQHAWTSTHPKTFAALRGVWGARGYTKVQLEQARTPVIRAAMKMAWQNASAAPARQPSPTTTSKPAASHSKKSR